MTSNEISGWFDWHSFYQSIVGDAPPGSQFVEVGVWLGRSVIFLAEQIHLSGKEHRVFAVDTFEGGVELKELAGSLSRDGRSVRDRFEKNVFDCGMGSVITTLVCRSDAAALNFKDATVYCAFIDASHEYGDVLADIRAWLPKITPGGVIAGHDANRSGVMDAVKEVFGDNYETDNMIWIHRVPDPNRGKSHAR